MKLRRNNLLLLGAISLTAPSLHAGNTWDGGGTNALWGSANNWDPNGAPNYALALNFQGGTRTTSQNNRTAGSTVADINFTNDGTTGKTAAFTLQGPNATTTNSMTLGGNITTTASSSVITDTIHASLDIILNANRTITTNTNHGLRIDGQISETGGSWSITKEGVGQLVLGNASLTTNQNSFSGGLNINNGVVSLVGSTGVVNAAGSGTITLGATSGSNDVELRLSGSGMNPTNTLVVQTGSSGTKTLANRSTNTVIYKGIITANDNLTIAGANGSGRLTVDAAGSSVANGKTVSFVNTGASASAMGNSATWSGQGSLSYTSNSAMGFTVSGDNTYSGGTTLGAMSGTGVLVATISSTGPANAPTSGAFGTGTLSIGATKMRGGTTANITIGNAVTFTDNATFTTTTGEKSLIFSGDVSLGATRTLTVEIGSTVATEALEFSGEISGTGFGITKGGAGTLVLSGNNSYTGATDVTNGKLVVNGNISTSSLTTVAVGSTLSGSGTVGAAIINGTLSVGNSPGQMNFTDALTLAGTTIMEIDGNAGAGVTGGHDFVNLTGVGPAGVLTYGGTLTIDIGAIFAPGSYSWNLFDMASETGAFSSMTVVGEYSATLLDIDTDGIWDFSDPDNTWQFTESTGELSLVTVVPEPRAALLGGLGLLALLRRRR